MTAPQLGAQESQASNCIWVNLRLGNIAQTSKTPVEGFSPCMTVNSSDVESHFFAKTYDHIYGYVTDLRWHTKQFDTGSASGWNITIDTTQQVFVLYINSMDRPYHRFMNCLLNADLSKPILFVGFMGEYKGKKQKVLLLSQEYDEAAGKSVWLQPAYQERWMSNLIKDKIRQGLTLTPDEEKNIAYDADGKADKDYPYIIQKQDGKWSFDRWDDFLIEKMKEEVIPSIQEAQSLRQQDQRSAQPDDDHGDVPDFAGPMSGDYTNNDDEIPF